MPMRVQGPELVFITQTGPKKSRDAQSQVRKHVMKDIGKARRKEGKKLVPVRFELEVPESMDSLQPRIKEAQVLDVSTLPRISQDTSPYVTQGVLVSSSPDVVLDKVEPFIEQQAAPPQTFIVPSIERLWTGRMDPFIKYPINMDRNALRLMDHVFDDRYGNTPPFRDAWLPVGMYDAATFHQVLSNAALNLASLRSRDLPAETHEAMLHHTKAVTLLKKSLSNKRTATSDNVIAGITAFACYAHVTGNQDGWHMHMNAVKEIVRLRGGIDNLNANKLLRIVLFWVDVGGACTEDIRPFFPIPTNLLFEPLTREQFTPPPLTAVQISQSWNSIYPEHFEIMHIMNELRSFIVYLGSEVRRTQGGTYSRGHLAASNILPIQHRLLNLTSPGEVDGQPMVEILRLACFLLMAEVRRLFGIMGVLSSVQMDKLRAALEEHPYGWEPFMILKAWVLAVGGMESSGSVRTWFLAELEKAKIELGVGSWEELMGMFRDILWYEEVHDQIFIEFCNGVEPVPLEGHLLGGSRFGGYRPLRL